MRVAKLLCLGFIAAAALACPAHPQDADQSLRLYTVHVIRIPKEPCTGYGIYLGNGIVITAAHVAGLDRGIDSSWTSPARIFPRMSSRKANSATWT